MPHATSIALRSFSACALALALLAPAQAAPVLQMNAVQTDGGVTLTVQVQDISDLYAFQFTLNYDPALLTARDGGTEGSFLAGGGSTFFGPGEIDSAAGTISYVFNTLIGDVPGVSGSGDLASFSFGVARGGFASFSLSDVLFMDVAFDDIDVATSELVTEVPEPASLWLAGAGLFALLGRGAARRRSARAA